MKNTSNHAEIFSQLFEISTKSFYRWKSKDHILLIDLIEKYFEDDDIAEFLKTGKISRFEMLPDIDIVIKNIEKKLRDTLVRFLGKFDRMDFTFKIENICWVMGEEKEEKEEITLSNLLIFINTSNTSDHNNRQELKAIEKIAYTAAISSLSEFEFKIARRYGLL